MFLLACHSSVADGFTIPQKPKTLLQILVEELPKRGGWPESAVSAVQDSDLPAVYVKNKIKFAGEGFDIHFDGENWVGSWTFGCSHDFGAQTLASDHTTAIITRDMYEAALAAKNDGWIEWAGGKCPVEEGTLVDVRYRNGHENHHVHAGEWCDDTGSDPAWCAENWTHSNNNHDIIAYRLHQPQDANSRANDDRLAQHAAAHAGFASTSRDEETDLNDCIGQTPEDTTLLIHFLLDEINDADVNMRLDDAYELAQHLISVGYRKQ